MGTRINVLMNHDIVDDKDQSAVLLRLETALPAALAVGHYWNPAATSAAPEQNNRWIADPVMPYETHWRSYTGPGSLFLKVGPHAAKIRTGGRWRGFLSIPPLYQVHLQAFRAIAQALGASKAVYFADCDDVDDAFYEGGDVETGIGILTGYRGLPQPSINEIAPEIVAKTDYTVPSVWYYEKLEKPIHDR